MSDDLRAVVRAAAALADETRVRILAILAEGDATVSELTARTGLPQPRVSTHLATLRDAGLVTSSSSGRQHTYHANATNVNAAFSALGALAPTVEGRAPVRSAGASREVRQNSAIRQARSCYDHLAGVAGVELMDALVARGWLDGPIDRVRQYALTTNGAEALAARGVDVQRARGGRRALAIGCLDWTERRHHLAGALGAELLRALERDGVTNRVSDTRSLELWGSVERWLDGEPKAT